MSVMSVSGEAKVHPKLLFVHMPKQADNCFHFCRSALGHGVQKLLVFGGE